MNLSKYEHAERKEAEASKDAPETPQDSGAEQKHHTLFGKQFTEKEQKTLFLYLVIGIVLMELAVTVGAIIISITNAQPSSSGVPHFQFPWIGYLVAVVMDPCASAMLLVNLVSLGFSLGGARRRRREPRRRPAADADVLRAGPGSAHGDPVRGLRAHVRRDLLSRRGDEPAPETRGKFPSGRHLGRGRLRRSLDGQLCGPGVDALQNQADGSRIRVPPRSAGTYPAWSSSIPSTRRPRNCACCPRSPAASQEPCLPPWMWTPQPRFRPPKRGRRIPPKRPWM